MLLLPGSSVPPFLLVPWVSLCGGAHSDVLLHTFGFSLRGCLPLSPFPYNSLIPQGFQALHLGKEYAYCSLHLLSAFERVNRPRPPLEPDLKLFLRESHDEGFPPFSPSLNEAFSDQGHLQGDPQLRCVGILGFPGAMMSVVPEL